jgi:hypothetical protein
VRQAAWRVDHGLGLEVRAQVTTPVTPDLKAQYDSYLIDCLRRRTRICGSASVHLPAEPSGGSIPVGLHDPDGIEIRLYAE